MNCFSYEYLADYSMLAAALPISGRLCVYVHYGQMSTMVKCIHSTGNSANIFPGMHRDFLSMGFGKHGKPLCNQLSGARQFVLSIQMGKSSDRQQLTTEARRLLSEGA